jgi:lysophosphatidic acid acyltransferase/lysophosphatidylinositol acyltransferase
VQHPKPPPQLLFLADWWSGARLTLHADPACLAGLGTEHSLILMNHHYELDWLFGWMVGDRAGVLGNCRVYVKKMIQWVPILGWGWRLSDTVFLARDWAADQATLREGLVQLQDYPDPMWVLLFPEGTRYTPEKYAASRQFAESRGLPVLRHCLVPRSKGFSFTVANLEPGRVRWVYDVTLACGRSPAPTLTSALLGRPATASMYIRRFRMDEVMQCSAVQCSAV